MALRYDHIKRFLLIVSSSVLVMWNAASMAADYQPNEFLNLDLSKAALSPKPLGPANTFGSVPAKPRPESDAERSYAHAKVTPLPARSVHASAEKQRGTARTRLAHRHRNLLDAQAMDTRIQVWPCKSGPMCKWTQ